MLGEPSSRGKGLGTDAMVTLLRYLFDDRQLERVWLSVLTWNEPAIASYKKVGFVVEGMLKEDCWIEGALHNQLYWEFSAQNSMPGGTCPHFSSGEDRSGDLRGASRFCRTRVRRARRKSALQGDRSFPAECRSPQTGRLPMLLRALPGYPPPHPR